ncbi:MAG: ankyrin repeat domain-containing protein [Gemmatales bacterium]
MLDAGEDPNRFNPEGFHSHSTPLHQAVWADHLETVKYLVQHGARLDMRDTLYDATPPDWANHGNRTAIAEYLRGR